MIIPACGKILVEVFSLKHPLIHLPETVALPKLSMAAIVDGNGNFITGQRVLVPTRAGLVIRENNINYRLINEVDVVARIDYVDA